MFDGTVPPPSDTTATPGFRTRIGEPIVAGQRYAVTPDGLPDVNAPHLMFIAPEHQWHIEWAPEVAAMVHLTREDHRSWSSAWLSPLGLLGLSVHAVRGKFRSVSPAEFRAAADEITDQMSRHHPTTHATVVLPEGFTLCPVSPSMVAGSVEAHKQSLLAQPGTAQ